MAAINIEWKCSSIAPASCQSCLGDGPDWRASILEASAIAVVSLARHCSDLSAAVQMFKGMTGSEDQAAAIAAQVKKLSPSHVRMISKAAGVVQGSVQVAQAIRQWVATNLVIVLCIVVLVFAVLLRWYGIM